MRVQKLEVEALHELPHLVGADLRRLTLKSGKRKAESGKPSPGLAATLSHRMGEGLGVRALLRVGSWPQSASTTFCQNVQGLEQSFCDVLLSFGPQDFLAVQFADVKAVDGGAFLGGDFSQG